MGNASGDACLFAESYVLDTATAKLAGSEWQDTVRRACCGLFRNLFSGVAEQAAWAQAAHLMSEECGCLEHTARSGPPAALQALRMLRFYLGLDPAPQTNNPELAPLLAWLPSDAAATVQTVYGGLPVRI